MSNQAIEKKKIHILNDTIYRNFVVLFNDDINSFDHVEVCLMKICLKTKEEAKKIAMEAHNKGKAICYKGSLEECETVAEKMGEAGLTVELQ